MMLGKSPLAVLALAAGLSPAAITPVALPGGGHHTIGQNVQYISRELKDKRNLLEEQIVAEDQELMEIMLVLLKHY